MHSCLRIAEILDNIVHEIDADSEAHRYQCDWWRFSSSDEAKATYSSLARTCRIFYEPSMDALWGKMDSLDPFKMLLAREDKDGTYDDYRRLLANAARVRTLMLQPCYTLEEDLKTLKTHLPHIDTLFSNLRILKLGPGIPPDGPLFLTFLLEPTLERCELLVAGILGPRATSAILLHLAKSAPGLKDLEIEGSKLSKCADMLLSFHRPESFRCPRGDLTKAALLHLAQLPSLRLAEFSLGVLEALPVDELGEVFFPSLHNLWIHSDHSTSSILQLLESIQSSTLSSLAVACRTSSSDDFNAILGAISKFKDLHLLVVSVMDHGSVDGRFEHYTIMPLLGLHNLVHLSVEAPGITCSEDDIPRFAEAWPYMSSLALCHPSPNTLPLLHPSFPLNTLRLFSKHMPMLDALEIDVDMSFVPKPLSAADRNMHSIELSLGRNPLRAKMWAKAAAFISSVYPNASILIGQLSRNCRHWRKVQAVVKAYGRLLNDDPAEPDSDMATDSVEEESSEGSETAEGSDSDEPALL